MADTNKNADDLLLLVNWLISQIDQKIPEVRRLIRGCQSCLDFILRAISGDDKEIAKRIEESERKLLELKQTLKNLINDLAYLILMAVIWGNSPPVLCAICKLPVVTNYSGMVNCCGMLYAPGGPLGKMNPEALLNMSRGQKMAARKFVFRPSLRPRMSSYPTPRDNQLLLLLCRVLPLSDDLQRLLGIASASSIPEEKTKPGPPS